ncbi:MAG: hypothetical protein AAF668_13935 [Pseudomonadota bacterium]
MRESAPADTGGNSNIALPVKPKFRPWKLIKWLLVIVAIVFIFNTGRDMLGLGEAASPNEPVASPTAAVVSRIAPQRREREREETPRLIWILGDDCEILYNGATYRISGSGPIGLDYHVGLLDGGRATLYRPDGSTLVIGTDRDSAPDLRRGRRESSGSVSGDSGDRRDVAR